MSIKLYAMTCGWLSGELGRLMEGGEGQPELVQRLIRSYPRRLRACICCCATERAGSNQIGPNDECFDGYPELSIEDWHKKHGLWIE